MAWDLSFTGQGRTFEHSSVPYKPQKATELAARAKPPRNQDARRISSVESQAASPGLALELAAGIQGQRTGFQVAELVESE